MLRIDHVVYAVRDLDATAERFRRDFGLDSVVGGRHEGWGTANRIVPLGEQYVELLAVVDAAEAEATMFGRRVLERIEAGDGWYTLALATDDVVMIGERLELEIDAASRERPDGEVCDGGWPGSTTRGASRGCRSSSRGTCPGRCTPGALAPATASGPRASPGSRSAGTRNGSARGSGTRSCRSESPMIDPGSGASRS
jgi:hypothetical protein